MNVKKIIKSNINTDKLIFQKNGNIKVKDSYFYKHGRDENKLADSIRTVLRNENIEIEIIEKSNHYNTWPKSSWFEVIFKVI